MMEIRISLTGKEFKKLVAGKVVVRNISVLVDGEQIKVEIALKDIGFGAMTGAVRAAHKEGSR